jgi:uncharacterized protein YdeI (YjbR/CyaY-like superfamily)
MDPKPTHFPNQAAFRTWLRRHHKAAASLTLRIAKTHAAHTGITYGEALDEALCFGWIDGVRRRLDGDSFCIRFSPRKPRSIWSRVNLRHVDRLIQGGRMAKAGREAFEARTPDRTGVYSFEQRPTRLGRAQVAVFRQNRRAWAYFQKEAPWYQRTSSFWVLSAKREDTRRKRLALLIECSANGQRIPPLRRSSTSAT